jgi:hypothetical protein
MGYTRKAFAQPDALGKTDYQKRTTRKTGYTRKDEILENV